MNTYELLYIVPSQYTDTEIEKIQETVAKLLTKQGGEVTRNENLGKIKLAYPIKKETYGSYVLVHFATDPEHVEKINRILGLTEEVLRHMLTTMPEGAEEKKYEITGYVPPLSPKGHRRGGESKSEESSSSSDKKRKRTSKKSTDTSTKKLKVKKATPKKAEKTDASTKNTAETKAGDEEKKTAEEKQDKDKTLTMEELDKRLDEILDSDLIDQS